MFETDKRYQFAVFFLEKLKSCGFTLGGSGLIGMGGLAAIQPPKKGKNHEKSLISQKMQDLST